MAISLTAEQKSLSRLFAQREQYIIPNYQRPYSWGLEQCGKLYDDINEAFNADTDYFLGNIILAVGERTKDKPRVVDGQQRLISIWLIFKVLSILKPDVKILSDAIQSYNWDGSGPEIKVFSEVIESDDKKILNDLLGWEKSNFDFYLKQYTKTDGSFVYPDREKKIIANGLYFYHAYKNFLQSCSDDEFREYLRFFLEQVSILPIELIGSNQEEANDRALTIFETINNRGMDLADADIFKARLYVKAITEADKEEFIELWRKFKEAAENIHLTIDDVFRYYSHILRGGLGSTKNEISLREFFSTANSPISQKDYKEVMSDLMRITMLLTEYDELKWSRTELAAWLQLIDAYTNTYPRYAVLVYLFHHGFGDEKSLLNNLRSIVRYCYQRGSTTYVKFEIYNMIKQISQNKPLNPYYNDSLKNDDLNYLGRLKYAYALLAQYLEYPRGIQADYCVDRLLSNRDEWNLDDSWKQHSLYNHLDDLGNLAVLDTYKVSKIYADKQKVYVKTSISELHLFLENNPKMISYDALMKRTERKKQLIINFFQGIGEYGENRD